MESLIKDESLIFKIYTLVVPMRYSTFYGPSSQILISCEIVSFGIWELIVLLGQSSVDYDRS